MAGSPTTTPAPPVVTVPIGLGPAVRAAVRSHRAALLTWGECLAVLVAGLATMSVRDGYAPATWVALAGAVCVAATAQPHAWATADVEALPVLRTLAVVFAAAAAMSVLGLSGPEDLAASAWVLAAAALVKLGALQWRRRTAPPARVVVVGSRAAITRAAMRWSDGSVQVVGGMLTGQATSQVQSIVGVPTVSGLEQVGDWATRRCADLVVIVPGDELPDARVRSVAWSLERTGIRMAVADLGGAAAPHRLRPRRLGPATVVELTPSRRGAVARMTKSVVDRLVGTVLLVCAVPFLAVVALVVRLDSPGPAVFRQVRMGRDNRPFTMYKFRTMHVRAERELLSLLPDNEGAGPLFKLHDDPRVTRVGRLLRRTSLDELPQLLNVVKGDMSLVGPRPALPVEVAAYDDVERRRLAVRPGMTGSWQVSGRSDLPWETGISLDLDYVDNGRLADDVRICLRTVGAVAKGRGAY